MSAPMIRALLAGTKTQTRRAVKLPHMNPLGQWEPTDVGGPHGGRTRDGRTIPAQQSIWHTRTGDSLLCPYGQPGDRLWVREAFRTYDTYDAESMGEMQARLSCSDDEMTRVAPIHYVADGERRNWLAPDAAPGRYRHARFMPRWASRITLEITGVRVERLHEISEADAIAEGVHPDQEGRGDDDGAAFWRIGPVRGDSFPIARYAALWESINGSGPARWRANPFVWVVEFKRVQPC